LVTITVKIPRSLNKRLEAEAAGQRLSKSTVIRRALDQYLMKPGLSRRQAAFETIKDLCGIIKDGPSDMSADPKYLAGFGR
jgi:predicted transcriptional regulator